MTIKDEIRHYEHKIKVIDRIIGDLKKHPDKLKYPEEINEYASRAEDYRHLVRVMHLLDDEFEVVDE